MDTSTLQLGARPSWASSLAQPALSRDGEEDARSSFASILGRASADTTKSPDEQARDAARQFVAVTLVQPLLKQLRESNTAAAPFAPSSGEKQFQSVIDADLALKITGAAHFPLVDRLAGDLAKRAAERAQAAAERAQPTP
ncbi:MAG: hypothetical protein K2Q20_04425 [Phycisphaerales bacterium]|nr:hypothetical protein [Phycisphaerales bacterium]